MARGSEITKKIKQAKREKPKKGKKKTPPPAGIHPPPGGWAEGEAVIVKAGDRNLLRIGCKLVKNTGKNAIRINTGMDIPVKPIEERINEADGIIGLIDSADSRSDVTIAPHLLACARVAVKLEYGKIKKLKKDQEGSSIEDTKALDKRLKELDRLGQHLGIQGSLELKDLDEDTKDDQSDLLPDG